MAQRAIREFDAKNLLARQLKGTGFAPASTRLAIKIGDDLAALGKASPWLASQKLVVKPDQLFGKKGKHNLVLLDADWPAAQKFLKENLGKDATVGKTSGRLERFLVEPFVAHRQEFYFAVSTERADDVLLFSEKGGVDIEAQWETVKKLRVSVGHTAAAADIEKQLLAGLPSALRPFVAKYLEALHKAFIETDMAFLELNPFTVVDNKPVALGVVVRLDDTASFLHDDWEGIEFPTPFGRPLRPEETFIADLDAQTGASLKLTVLNPQGSVWLLVAGGGASVIYTDTVADLGFGGQLGNYGEYSGDPSAEHTYLYAKTVLGLMLASPAKKKSLIIGGGIANFTDVAKTFKGIVRALSEQAEGLRKANVRIFVRRGGPNYAEGLKMMRQLGEEIKVPMEVFGPETHMTSVVPKAIAWVKP